MTAVDFPRVFHSLPGLFLEVARRLRTEPWAQCMMLIALTGFGQDDDKRRAFESGFDRHLPKPIDTAYLCSIMADALTPA